MVWRERVGLKEGMNGWREVEIDGAREGWIEGEGGMEGMYRKKGDV